MAIFNSYVKLPEGNPDDNQWKWYPLSSLELHSQDPTYLSTH